jgi:hypothetical protein
MRALAPEGIFLSRVREFRGWQKRTSAAKAGYGGVIYGTAEAVPFLKDRFLTPASCIVELGQLLPRRLL